MPSSLGEVDFEPSKALAVPTLPIFVYISFAMLGQAHVDAYTWNIASCEMCELVLCAFWKCACSDVVNGIVHDRRLLLYVNPNFGILHRFPTKMTEFVEKLGICHVLERTSFPFVKGYLAAEVTQEFHCSVFNGLDWVPYT